jgi:hypothetical protein
MEDSRMPKHPFLKSIPPSRKMPPSVPSTFSVVQNLSQGTAPRSSDATTIWMLPQSDSYLQLSQVLHQTRKELQNEIQRRIDVQNISWNQSQEITHWTTSCENAYAAMNQHRLESEGLHHDNQLLKYENTFCGLNLSRTPPKRYASFRILLPDYILTIRRRKRRLKQRTPKQKSPKRPLVRNSVAKAKMKM